MDIGSIAYDITVRKLESESQISFIYAACIDEGICTVKKSEFTELPGSAWIAEATIGEAIDAAIEFDGYWITTQYPFTFNTDEDPWVAWVTPTGSLNVRRLYAQKDPLVLATDVSKVAIVRGWKNTIDIGQDHGMIVLYIKNGVPYYRTYAEQTTGSMAWEAERPLAIFSGTAVDINGFRTNDYRVGINILDSTDTTHSFITHRNWSGMASPAENLDTSITDITFEVTPITYHETSSDDERIESSIAIERFYVCPTGIVPAIVGTERLSFLDKKTVQVMFNYELECELDNLKASLTLTNEELQPFTIETVEEAGNVLTIKTVEEMPFARNVILTYNMVGSYYLAFRISSTCLYDYGNSINLTIDGVPPVGFTEENLEAAVTDIVFDVTQVYYSTAYNGGENLEASIIDISFVVTKVGHNPL
jgi:hypothetical protein